jgi:acetyl-CoA acyltransferase
VTVNRLCGSGLQAINQAAHAIAAGAEDVHIVGGLEHMLHLPLGREVAPNHKLYRHTSATALQMGMTAEHLAGKFKIDRHRQDAFACRSHRLAAAAHAAGDWAGEIVAVCGHDEAGLRVRVDRDQCIRPETSADSLAGLRPVFVSEGGTVTAGNSSPTADGAAALLMMSEDRAADLGLTPRVRVFATAVAGTDPCLMGLGPVPATEKALHRAGLTWNDINLIELNEAFAVQALACLNEWQMSDEQVDERVNLRGGAIALGHPLGASGTRIVITLINLMLAGDAELGLATMCVGLGQGVATILQRVS